MNCSRARRGVEQTICADPALKQADARLSAQYESIYDQTEGLVRKRFAAQQRRWLESRDRLCAAASISCLSSSYTLRQEQLDALAARSSDIGPGVISSINPLTFRGAWVSGSFVRYSGTLRLDEDSLNQEGKLARLPAPSQVITGYRGRLCYDKDCQVAGLARSPLTPVLQNLASVAGIKLKPSRAAYSVIFSKWIGFDLVIGVDGRILAKFNKCLDRDPQECALLYQVWQPKSSGTGIVEMIDK